MRNQDEKYSKKNQYGIASLYNDSKKKATSMQSLIFLNQQHIIHSIGRYWPIPLYNPWLLIKGEKTMCDSYYAMEPIYLSMQNVWPFKK